MNIDLKSFTDHIAQRVKSIIDPLERRLKELEARQPEKGDRGEKGDPGEPAVVIIDDVIDKLMSDAEFKSMVADAVAKQYAEHPPAPGADGKDGEKGAPGVGVAGGMIDKGGNLILTTSDGKTHNLGRVEGRDGLGFDDASATWDKEAQEVVMRYARGDVFKEVRYPAPVPTHVGFWQAGMQVKCGAFATHNGSLWYAMRTTSEEPTYQSKDWQLAARKGADGQHKTVKVAHD